MKIIKRNGEEATFRVANIKDAIGKANQKVQIDLRFTSDEIADIANRIKEIVENETHAVNVEDIQDFVETEIWKAGKKEVYNEYHTYRYARALNRQKNTTDDRILALLENKNEEIQQENANKNPTIVSTMRDYMAGEVSKDISARYLIPQDILKAHTDGIIHFHDMDYFAMPIYNCFHGDEFFITENGPKQFRSFNEGDTVTVLDLNGEEREATVHCYGDQALNEVELTTRTGFTKTVRVTPNHRWVLKDGSVTTSLKEGDVLTLTKNHTSYEITNKDDAKAWCYGFIVGDGVDNRGYTHVRLCGKKAQYKDYFTLAGFSVNKIKDSEDFLACCKGISKQEFLSGSAWRYLNNRQKSLVFKGYYTADGNHDRNSITTTDDRVANMIRDLSDFAGYYIQHEDEEVRSTNYKENARFINFKFLTETKDGYGWKVKSIKPYMSGALKKVYCVEEPVTHTFTLANGVVTGNCCLINLDDMLQNGTVISGTKIDKPHSFSTACNVATQIIAQVASSQYGGQTITASHLSPFVDVSRKNIEKEVKAEIKENNLSLTDDQIKNVVNRRLKKEIKDGIQTLQYQILTLMTTNGQTPFVSVCLYLNEAKDEESKEDLAMVIEEILRQRTKGVKNAVDAWVTNPFPKLLYVLEEDNVNEEGKYWYLTKLAAECTAKRMVPDYISEKKMMEIKEGDCFPCMGCRSFLNVYHEGGKKRGKTKYYGRFNQGVVTINLPDAALEAKGDIEKFWYILDSRLELCHRALRLRHEHLRKVKSDVAPILWQHGAMARLEPGEGIEKLLYNGYSSISLGYVGLYEAVKALTGKNHWEEGEGKDLGLEIMKRLNDKCKDWSDVEHIGYSVYGTPEESTT